MGIPVCSPSGDSVLSTAIHQEVLLAASPQRVFDALMDSTQFSELTGGQATRIGREAGDSFECFGGLITGRQIELKPNQRIVQAWRVGNWPEGVYSIVSFALVSESGGTKLTFDQSGFPPAQREHLDAGWHKMYWQPLKKFLSSAGASTPHRA